MDFSSGQLYTWRRQFRTGEPTGFIDRRPLDRGGAEPGDRKDPLAPARRGSGATMNVGPILFELKKYQSLGNEARWQTTRSRAQARCTEQGDARTQGAGARIHRRGRRSTG